MTNSMSFKMKKKYQIAICQFNDKLKFKLTKK